MLAARVLMRVAPWRSSLSIVLLVKFVQTFSCYSLSWLKLCDGALGIRWLFGRHESPARVLAPGPGFLIVLLLDFIKTLLLLFGLLLYFLFAQYLDWLKRL